jgi:hypothetical protein
MPGCERVPAAAAPDVSEEVGRALRRRTVLPIAVTSAVGEKTADVSKLGLHKREGDLGGE